MSRKSPDLSPSQLQNRISGGRFWICYGFALENCFVVFSLVSVLNISYVCVLMVANERVLKTFIFSQLLFLSSLSEIVDMEGN